MDNGQTVCSLSHRQIGKNPSTLSLDCIEGFSAVFDFDAGEIQSDWHLHHGAVTYSHGLFSDDFDTVFSDGEDGPTWKARVWCE